MVSLNSWPPRPVHRNEAMNRHERRKQAVIQRVPLKDLKPGPIRHLTLPPLLVTRIQQIAQTLKGYYDPPGGIVGWLEGFQRDMNPESEVVIWEKIARAITQWTQGREPLEPLARKELLGLALSLSFSPPYTPKYLTPAEAAEFLDILRKA